MAVVAGSAGPTEAALARRVSAMRASSSRWRALRMEWSYTAAETVIVALTTAAPTTVPATPSADAANAAVAAAAAPAATWTPLTRNLDRCSLTSAFSRRSCGGVPGVV
jgi:hypothetical protein